MNTRRYGVIGEKMAQKYLINKGYKILKTNFYTKKGEIDIIAKKNNCVVFVEVKTRNNLNYGTPAMAVGRIKKTHIKKSAEIFIYINKLYEYEVRFDLIEIIMKNGKCEINHIKSII